MEKFLPDDTPDVSQNNNNNYIYYMLGTVVSNVYRYTIYTDIAQHGWNWDTSMKQGRVSMVAGWHLSLHP